MMHSQSYPVKGSLLLLSTLVCCAIVGSEPTYPRVDENYATLDPYQETLTGFEFILHSQVSAFNVHGEPICPEGFFVADLEAIFKDNAQGRNQFLYSTSVTVPMWTSQIRRRRGIKEIQLYTGRGGTISVEGRIQQVEPRTFAWVDINKNFEYSTRNGSAADASTFPLTYQNSLPVGCARRSNQLNEDNCGLRQFRQTTLSSTAVNYETATQICQSTVGFYVPASSDWTYIKSEGCDRNEVGGLHSENAWVDHFDAVTTEDETRYAFCAGCHVNYRQELGVASVDRDGQVTCKAGFVKAPGQNDPYCLDGFWQNITQCAPTIVYFDGTQFLQIQNASDRQSLPTFNYNDALQVCEGVGATLPNAGCMSTLNAVSYMAHRWSFYTDQDHTFLTNTVGQGVNSMTYNTKLDPTSRAVPSCLISCVPATALGEYARLQASGELTCKAGHRWQCSFNYCHRDNRNPINCRGGVWRNLAHCLPGVCSVPKGYDAENTVFRPETGFFACKAGYHEFCLSPPCASRHLNIGLSCNDIGVYNNLPLCVRDLATSSVSLRNPLILPRYNAPVTFPEAEEICSGIGGRLPLPTEVARVNEYLDALRLLVEGFDASWVAGRHVAFGRDSPIKLQSSERTVIVACVQDHYQCLQKGSVLVFPDRARSFTHSEGALLCASSYDGTLPDIRASDCIQAYLDQHGISSAVVWLLGTRTEGGKQIASGSDKNTYFLSHRNRVACELPRCTPPAAYSSERAIINPVTGAFKCKPTYNEYCRDESCASSATNIKLRCNPQNGLIENLPFCFNFGDPQQLAFDDRQILIPRVMRSLSKADAEAGCRALGAHLPNTEGDWNAKTNGRAIDHLLSLIRTFDPELGGIWFHESPANSPTRRTAVCVIDRLECRAAVAVIYPKGLGKVTFTDGAGRCREYPLGRLPTAAERRCVETAGRIFGAPQSVWAAPRDKSGQGSTIDGKKLLVEDYTDFLCVVQIVARFALECDNRLWRPATSVPVTYAAAVAGCNLGFQLPQEEELQQLAEGEMNSVGSRCNAVAKLYVYDPRPWSLHYSHHFGDGTERRQYFCVGCRVHERQYVGMDRVDRFGNVTCNAGHVLVRDLSQPLIPHCHLGFWVNIGYCAPRTFFLGNSQYLEVRVDSNNMPVESTFQEAKEYCTSIAADALALRPASYAVKYLALQWAQVYTNFIGSSFEVTFWGKEVSEGINQNTVRTTVPASGTALVACVLRCQISQTADYSEGEVSLDGLVTCPASSTWHCLFPHCIRRPGTTKQCENGRWTNVATCFRGTCAPPANYDMTGALIDPVTGRFACKAGYHELCPSGVCASRLGDVAVRCNVSQQPYTYTNLPRCIRLGISDILDSPLVRLLAPPVLRPISFLDTQSMCTNLGSRVPRYDSWEALRVNRLLPRMLQNNVIEGIWLSGGRVTGRGGNSNVNGFARFDVTPVATGFNPRSPSFQTRTVGYEDGQIAALCMSDTFKCLNTPFSILMSLSQQAQDYHSAAKSCAQHPGGSLVPGSGRACVRRYIKEAGVGSLMWLQGERTQRSVEVALATDGKLYPVSTDLPFICSVRDETFERRTKEFLCGNSMVWTPTEAKDTYLNAETRCQSVVGYNIPAQDDYDYLRNVASDNKKCTLHTTLQYADGWKNIFNSERNVDYRYDIQTDGEKTFFCIGCRLDYRQEPNVANLDRFGVITCNPGFVYVGKTPDEPTCVDGLWRGINGYCTQITYNLGNNEFLSLRYDVRNNTPVRSPVANGQAYCEGESAKLPSTDNELAATSRVSHEWELTFKALQLQQNSTFFTAVSGIGQDGIGSHTISKFTRELTTCAKSQCSSNMPLSGLSHFDIDGNVVCKRGQTWHCDFNHCPGDGNVPKGVVCRGGKWEIARCLPRVCQLPAVEVPDATVVEFTGRFRCNPGFYEFCLKPGECASEIANVKLRCDERTGLYTNAPRCMPLSFLHILHHSPIDFESPKGQETRVLVPPRVKVGTYLEAVESCRSIGARLPVPGTREVERARLLMWRLTYKAPTLYGSWAYGDDESVAPIIENTRLLSRRHRGTAPKSFDQLIPICVQDARVCTGESAGIVMLWQEDNPRLTFKEAEARCAGIPGGTIPSWSNRICIRDFHMERGLEARNSWTRAIRDTPQGRVTLGIFDGKHQLHERLPLVCEKRDY